MLQRWVAVSGKTGGCRVVSVFAETKEQARVEVIRVLGLNAQRRKIRETWSAYGGQVRLDE